MHSRPTNTTLCIAFFIFITQFVSSSIIPKDVSSRGTSAFNNGKPFRPGFEHNPTGSSSFPTSFPSRCDGCSETRRVFNTYHEVKVLSSILTTGSLFCNGPYGIDSKAGIPFSRANRGKLLFYGKGEGNTPDGVSDRWM